MNKQAFTFLTLFTLVLLLSVYYVTVPADSGSIHPDSLISYVEEDVIEQYDKEKKQLLEDLKQQNEQVISSSDSTSAEKLEALQNNAELSVREQIELDIEAMLKQQGYESCFVEKDSQIVRIVLPKENQSQSTAVQIMKWVDEMMDEKVLIEVSFE